jgi:hypothetical protein
VIERKKKNKKKQISIGIMFWILLVMLKVSKSGASNSPSELIEGRLVNEHVIYSIK